MKSEKNRFWKTEKETEAGYRETTVQKDVTYLTRAYKSA